MTTRPTDSTLDEEISAIQVKVEPQASQHIKGSIGPMMKQLEAIAKDTAKQDRVRVTDIEVRYSELMEDSDMPFIRMVLHTGPEVSPDEAFDFWDSVGDGIDEWVPTLEPRLQKIFDKKVTLTIEWVEPDAI